MKLRPVTATRRKVGLRALVAGVAAASIALLSASPANAFNAHSIIPLTLPTTPGAASTFSADGKTMYLGSQSTWDVNIFDFSTNTILDTVHIGPATPVGTMGRPTLSRDGSVLYIPGYRHLYAMSTAAPHTVTDLGAGAWGSAPSSALVGDTLFIVSGGLLYSFDTTTNVLDPAPATIALGTATGGGARSTVDGSKLIVTEGGAAPATPSDPITAGAFKVYDETGAALLGPVPLPEGYAGVAVSPDGTTLALGSRAGNEIYFASLIDGSFSSTRISTPVPTPNLSYSPDGTVLYASNQLDTVLEIDVATGEILAQHDVLVSYLYATGDGSSLVGIDNTTGTIHVFTNLINTSTVAPEATLVMGEPVSIDIRAGATPEPAYALTGDLPDGLEFDPSTGLITGTPTVAGTFAFTISADNGVFIGTQDFSFTVEDQSAPEAPSLNPSNGTTVSGTAEAGATVTVRDGAGTIIGTTTVGADGTFTATVSPALADGEQATVTVTDAAGNASDPTTVTADASAPAKAIVDPTTGTTVTGTAEPGSSVAVRDATGKVIASAKASADGKFVVVLEPKQATGAKLSIVVTDAAGNLSDAVEVTVVAASAGGTAGAPALASTGVEIAGVLGAAGALLLIGGALLALMRLRRRTAAAS